MEVEVVVAEAEGAGVVAEEEEEVVVGHVAVVEEGDQVAVVVTEEEDGEVMTGKMLRVIFISMGNRMGPSKIKD